MTEAEVRQVLGSPTSTGTSEYIGAGGAPVVYRTEHFRGEWDWPLWWPWPIAKAKA